MVSIKSNHELYTLCSSPMFIYTGVGDKSTSWSMLQPYCQGTCPIIDGMAEKHSRQPIPLYGGLTVSDLKAWGTQENKEIDKRWERSKTSRAGDSHMNRKKWVGLGRQPLWEEHVSARKWYLHYAEVQKGLAHGRVTATWWNWSRVHGETGERWQVRDNPRGQRDREETASSNSMWSSLPSLCRWEWCRFHIALFPHAHLPNECKLILPFFLRLSFWHDN